MTVDLDKLQALAEGLSGQEWYMLGPPWVGFTHTFTILRGSPDPHVGVAILETVEDEEADETDDHYQQEALAEWLQAADPNTILAFIAELKAAREKLAEREGE